MPPELEGLDTAGIFTAGIDDEDFMPPDDEGGEKDKGKSKKETPPDKEAEAKAAAEKEAKEKEEAEKAAAKPDRLAELEKELEKSKKEIARLGYALRKEGKESKPKAEGTPFTKVQLMQLYKEHQDEPEVVFQIFEEMQKMGKVDAQAAAEKSVDIKHKRTEMDAMLTNLYPDTKNEGTEVHGSVMKAVEYLHLDGHPFADFLAVAAMQLQNLPKMVADIKAKAEKEALEKASKTSQEDLAKKAEEARKKKVEESKPGEKGKTVTDSKSSSLSAEQLETAKRLGFRTKEQLARYSKILSAKSGTVQAEA